MIAILRHGSVNIVDQSPMEYEDNQYDFAFQFPQDWKLQKTPTANEYGEIRAIVKHPTRPVYAEVIVNKVGKVVTKEQYESNPNRDAIVSAFMEFTVDQIYKKTSRDIGADRLVVAKKEIMPSSVGIEFYISTMQVKDDVPITVFGIHAVPFDKPYMLAFIVVSPLDKTKIADNDAVTKMFNSFHVMGERPVN